MDGSGFAPVFESFRPYEVIFYTQANPILPIAGFPGHAFVQFRTEDNGPKPGTIVTIGKYPNGSIDFAPAQFGDDADKVWSHRIAYDVSQQQFDAAVNYAKAQASGHPIFTLLQQNCTDFVVQVARAAGITLPGPPNEATNLPSLLKGSIDGLSVPNPGALDLALTTALVTSGRNPTLLNGGVVMSGDGSTAGGAPDPPSEPDPSSPTSMLNTGLSDPSGLASGFGFRYDDTMLAPISIAMGGSVQAVETGSLPAELALYGVDWGDGSPQDYFGLPAGSTGSVVPITHTYTTAGSFGERLIVIDNGALEEYDTQVSVSQGGSPTVSEQFAIPAPPTDYTYNSGNPPADIADLSVIGAASFGISTTSIPNATPANSYGPVSLSAESVGTSTSPYTTTLKWKKITLPKGLRLSSAGVLSGTLSKKVAVGPSFITVQVTETVITLNGKKKVKTPTTVQATIPLTIS